MMPTNACRLFVMCGSRTFFILSICMFAIAAGCGNQVADKSQSADEKETIKSRAESMPITPSNRKKWIKTIKPASWLKGSEGCKVVWNSEVPKITAGGKQFSTLSTYFGYLFDEFGYKFTKQKTHDRLAKAYTDNGITHYFIHCWIDVPEGYVGFERARPFVHKILQYDPDARFILRVYIRSREKFATEFPNDVAVFNDGATSHYTSPNRAWMSNSKTPRYSFGSLVWERYAAVGIEKLVEKLGKEDFADRVDAAALFAGANGEWLAWFDYDMNLYSLDYSPAMRKRFGEYLSEKYADDLKELRAAWEDPCATFDAPTIPSPTERGKDIPSSLNEDAYTVPGTLGYFRDPNQPGNQKVIDYMECEHRLIQQRIAYLCEAFKRACDGKLLVGGVAAPFSILGYKSEGRCDYRPLLDCHYIDFWLTPWAYEGRSPCKGLPFTGPVSSMQLHKQFYMIECDTRTSLMSAKLRPQAFGAASDIQGDVNNLRRDLTRLVTYNNFGYWFEMQPGWYDNPVLFEAIEQITHLGKFCQQFDRKRNSEIAVIFDSRSALYGSEWISFLGLTRNRLQEFGHIGADYDMYAIEDISNPRLQNYKLYIFPYSVALNNHERKAIDQKLKKQGKTILWMIAPGLINPDAKRQLDVRHMAKLTGMNFGYISERQSMDMIPSGNNYLTLPLGGKVFGSFTRPITSGHNCTPDKPFFAKHLQAFPQFFVDDSEAKALATYVDTGRVGLAVKKMSDWTSIFSATPALPASVLRQIALSAGVHIYMDTDDVVYHNKSLLAIHAVSTGKKRVCLPTSAGVYDLFNNKWIASNTTSFYVQTIKGGTYLYYIGPPNKFPAHK